MTFSRRGASCHRQLNPASGLTFGVGTEKVVVALRCPNVLFSMHEWD
ncbi:hypothetical protein J2X72_004296 [Phyllobacterium sp. 1468]|nr:hypothetical protein [Phyllobacterium sp. 1468]